MDFYPLNDRSAQLWSVEVAVKQLCYFLISFRSRDMKWQRRVISKRDSLLIFHRMQLKMLSFVYRRSCIYAELYTGYWNRASSKDQPSSNITFVLKPQIGSRAKPRYVLQPPRVYTHTTPVCVNGISLIKNCLYLHESVACVITHTYF